MLGVGVAAVAILGLVVFLASGDDDPRGESASTVADATTPAPTDDDVARPEADDESPDGTDDPDDDLDDGDDEGPTDDDPADPPTKTQTPTKTKAPATGSNEGIVFAPAQPAKMDFRAAAALCEAMNAGGASGWRLPTLGELFVLAKGRNGLQRDVYWSGTEADSFDNRALVWSHKKSRAAPIAKGWRGARGVCVHDPKD
jgi:hypothetical protein